jgi:hypothetical protein
LNRRRTSLRDVAVLLLDTITSLKLTIVCLAMLMIIVVACTLAQVNLGTFGAVNLYIRSPVIWWDVPGTEYAIPIFPGGALVGAVLLVNLFAAQLRRLEMSWRKSGIWIVHIGLILLFVGEFVTSFMQVETQLAIEQGQTLNYVEGKDVELAVIDTTDPTHDEVYSVPQRLLADSDAVAIPGTPVTVRVKRFLLNADLTNRGPTDPPSLATAGIGSGISVTELPPVSRDEEINRVTAFVEPVAGGRSYGTWLVSNALGAPQSFVHEGRTYSLAIRPRRYYLPYSITLKKFSHDVYPGTDIPKNFSSLVHLSNPGRGEERDVLIYMNQPLRYDGKAFYQASFGKGDTLSILQVVQNPGWLIPYISCVLVAIGLVIHFSLSLRRGMRRRQATSAPVLEASSS